MELLYLLLTLLVVFGIFYTFIKAVLSSSNITNKNQYSFYSSFSLTAVIFIFLLNNEEAINKVKSLYTPSLPKTSNFNTEDLLGNYRGKIDFNFSFENNEISSMSSGDYILEITQENDSLFAELSLLIHDESYKFGMDFKPLSNRVLIETLGDGNVGVVNGEVLILSTKENEYEFNFSKFQ